MRGIKGIQGKKRGEMNAEGRDERDKREEAG